ncbi:TonB-dependent receptor domain-containing protein [Marinirhabdus gelatinilytica]|uniref:Outer membrane receptor protein involved in Fe transport n=1 Tax=Marinirhabdus gelatinilytica TaxID=1703343 RepID=A0A370QB01_9FLAO|nr:outer membrane beta-barrel family protein [Marinirhabdus gelatinilytica]RDK85558.1 outer membrane receptor protein involved in Fe transport [Marinirhabdus gelatinilytica]
MKIHIVLVALLSSSFLFAQNTITAKGKVLEQGTNYPLEYATVSFVDPAGKTVEGGITDMDGNFAIEIPAGTYTVKYEFISYKTIEKPNQNLQSNTTLPTVYLSLDSESLDEVVVRAETTEVQVRLDKKVYNIGKDLTTSGATVSDALNNVPSVTVDVEGAIALRGNENVRILINGKPSAIAGFGSTDALRQLPAEAIERVEVITSPSARYDAEGTAGILNIILKKEKTLGLNGSVQVNLGVPLSSGITGNINVRTDKFNIFNTTGIRYRESPGNALFETQYLNANASNPLVIEDRDYDRLNRGFNTNLGIEYFLTENSSITASGFLRLGDDEDLTTNLTSEFDAANALAVMRSRIETETEEDTSLQFSLNYVNNFSDDGHKLTIDLQAEDDRETETSLIDEFNTFPATALLPSEFITQKEDQNEYLVQADYVLPIGENAQFEAGYRGTFEKTTTDYLLTEQLETGGPFIRNDSLSNVFVYEENVNALYTQYGNKFGKFSFLLGLRLEDTQLIGNVTGEDITTNDDFDVNFDNSYTELFPTVNLVYELGERENVTLGYNRRINRPRGFFVNPFPSRSSEANVFQGNPSLRPAFANAFDLGYLKRWQKLTLTSSIYYQRETDAFERVSEDTGEVTSNGVPIIRTIPINLATNERYGFEAGILYNPAKWLRLNGSFNLFRFKTEGFFNGVDYGTVNNSWFARGSSKVTLPSKIDWQTTAFYRGPRNDAQSETEGILSINLAFSKDIMDENATIGFNVSDLFNSRKRITHTETDSFISDSEFQWRERQFNLTFTYRFNQKKQRQRGGRDNGDFEDDGDFGGS